jgi:hypothetical protein
MEANQQELYNAVHKNIQIYFNNKRLMIMNILIKTLIFILQIQILMWKDYNHRITV